MCGRHVHWERPRPSWPRRGPRSDSAATDHKQEDQEHTNGEGEASDTTVTESATIWTQERDLMMHGVHDSKLAECGMKGVQRYMVRDGGESIGLWGAGCGRGGGGFRGVGFTTLFACTTVALGRVHLASRVCGRFCTTCGKTHRPRSEGLRELREVEAPHVLVVLGAVHTTYMYRQRRVCT